MPLLDRMRERLRFPADRTDMGGKDSTVFPPASATQVAAAEAALGFQLPALLREIYMTVANGGFGPGCGLLGLQGGKTFHSGRQEWNAVELYHSFRRYPTRHERWGEKLLPICHWGCSYFSYIDCALPSAPVLALDENSHGHGPWGCAFGLHAISFEEWMQRWINGEDLWKSFNAVGEPIFWFEEHPVANDNTQ
ncbi:MAG: hypothetical protein QOD11_1676 [Bradyrhizobium sp.]|jgi:hypothetical protein|nr:hypothetical protein [Bradyrhizobium sp.]